jgi:hypothetical protein
VLKVVLLLLGFAGGAAGATSWLLSDPPSGPSFPPAPEELSARLKELQTRLNEAVAEGRRAGADTERRLLAEFEAYRQGKT